MFDWLKAALSTDRRAPSVTPHSKEECLRAVRRIESSADPNDLVKAARLWNRIATLAQSDGDPEAPTYFGKAIDAYLESAHFDAAAAMCERMIRLHPEVVRARCTLAFLSVGRRHLGDAVQYITDYTIASKRSHTEQYAISRLRLMTEAVSDESILRCIASALGDMGDDEGKARALELIRNPSPRDPAYEDGRWERLLAVALLGRDQLRRRGSPRQDASRENVWAALGS